MSDCGEPITATDELVRLEERTGKLARERDRPFKQG